MTKWEPWNEPNNTGFADGGQYVTQVLAPFYDAVKSVLPRPASTVIGGSSLNVPIGWWQQLIAAGGLNDLDVASVHPYTGNNDSFEEDGIPAQVRQLQAMLGGKPLWFTEVGWWSDGDYNYLNQANIVARAMIWQKVLGIPVWNYFFDEGNWGNDGVSFSLIQASNTDDYVKPAALATMATASEIAHRPYLSMPATGIPQTYEASFGATAGGTDQVAVAAVWSDGLDTTGSVTVTAPGGGSVPVTVDLGVRGCHHRVGHLGRRLQPAHLRPGHLHHLPGGRHPHRRPHRGLRSQPGPVVDRSHRHRLVRQRRRPPSTGLPVGYDQGWARAVGDSDPGLTVTWPARPRSTGSWWTPSRWAARPPESELHRLGRRAVGLDHGGHRGRPVPDPRAATGLRPVAATGSGSPSPRSTSAATTGGASPRGGPPNLAAPAFVTCPPGLRGYRHHRPDRRFRPHPLVPGERVPSRAGTTTTTPDDDHHDDSAGHPPPPPRRAPHDHARRGHHAPTSGRRRLLADHQRGAVYTFGNAPFYGPTWDAPPQRPIVGMAATPDGQGYWLVSSDGGIFSFGDAGFYGSTGALTLNRPIVGMAVDPGRAGLLAGGLRRRHLRLRGRPLLRLDRGADPQPAHRGHGRHPGRAGLLAGGLRRWHLRLRGRRLRRLDRCVDPQPAHRGHGRPPRTGGATGWWPRTGGSSPSGTPASTARPVR